MMQELASLSVLSACDSFVNFDCGIGYFLLLLAMAHPQWKVACVEVVAFHYNILVQTRYQLFLSFSNFEHRVHLILGDFLSPAAQTEIDFTQLLVPFRSNMLLPERRHQALVQLIFCWCPVLHQVIKCQMMTLHFWGSFGDPDEVILQ